MSNKQEALNALENTLKSGGVVNFGRFRKKRFKQFDPQLPTDFYITGGGYPQGNIVIFWGKESSGKSTAAYQKANKFPVKKTTTETDKVTGEVWEKEWKVLLLESEPSCTYEYLVDIGSNPDWFDVKVVKTIEESYDHIRENMQHYSVIIWDSVNGTGSNEGYTKDADGKMMAVAAMRATDQMKIIQSSLYGEDCTLFGIFQARANMNRANKYSPEDKLSTSYAWKHAASMIIHYDAGAFIESDESDDIARRKTYKGKSVRVTCDKNKINSQAAGRNVTLTLVNGLGFSEIDDVFAVAKEIGIITGKGWYNFKEHKYQGEMKFKKFLSDNPEVLEEIRQLAYEKIRDLNVTKKED